MRFSRFLFEDAQDFGGTYSAELGNIHPIKALKSWRDEHKDNEKKASKGKPATKGYQSKDKQVQSGMEGQLDNLDNQLEQLRNKIIHLEEVIGRLKEQEKKTQNIQQKEGIKNQIKGYQQQLKNYHQQATTLIKNRHDMIEKHNEALQRKRAEAATKRDQEQKQPGKQDNSQKSTYQTHDEFKIQKPERPDLPNDWNKYQETDFQKLIKYYEDSKNYYEKRRQEAMKSQDPNVGKKGFDAAGKMHDIDVEINNLRKDWADLQKKRTTRKK